MKDLPTTVRPREKLLTNGAAALADVELLALFLRTGTKGTSVLQLAQAMLDATGGLEHLLACTCHTLPHIKGLGPAKRSEMAAISELARRALFTQLRQKAVLSTSTQVKDFVRLHLGLLQHEVFAVLFLNAQHQLIVWEEMFRGTLSQTSVYPREVVKRALACNASAVVLVHNHPSGLAAPSVADQHLTQHLQKTLALVDVKVLDHLVVGATEVVSLVERGLMSCPA